MIQVLSLLLVAACFAPTLAQQPLIFNHRTEDRAFLNYNYIWNQFDSSAVMYEFGEFTFVGGAIRHNILLSKTVKDAQRVQGSGEQGVSADLQALARTEDFIIPGEGEIQWFGRLQAFRSPCDMGYDPAQGEGPNRPIPNWGVLDQTEFVVQLIDAGSGTVLVTLDSVGVQPTGTVPPVVDTRYGTDVDRIRRSAAVPANHTGKLAYIRVSPRRYGPTPLGLIISRYDLWVNQSAKYDSTGTVPLSLSQIQVLREQWFTALLAYCDSVKVQTGWLPDLEGISFSRDSHLAEFHSRYFNPHVDAGGDTVWQEQHTIPFPKRGGSTAQTNTKIAPIVTLIGIAPNPVASENIELNMIVGMDINARLELISLDGNRLFIWEGFLTVGRGRLTVPISKDVSNGSYILVLYNEHGNRITQESLVIAR